MKPPFCIVGTQRSGAALLGRMLDAHPALTVLGAFRDRRLRVAGDRRAPAAELISMLARPATERPVAAGERIVEALQRAAGERRWGIEHPRLTYVLEELRDTLPGARFLFVVRDARGVCHSMMRRRAAVANVYHGALLWRAEVLRQRKFQRRHPDESHTLRFEDLVADPERELRRALAFLGEEFEPAMLPWLAAGERAGGPGDTGRAAPRPWTERWRHEMTPRQIGVVESLTTDLLRCYGHRPVNGRVRLTGIERRLYDLHQELMSSWRGRRRGAWLHPGRGLRRPVGHR